MDYSIMIQILNNDKYSTEQKAYEIFLTTLKPLQREIFKHIPKGFENAITCKEIKELTNIPTKNISTVISQLMVKYPIDSTGTERKLKYYRI